MKSLLSAGFFLITLLGFSQGVVVHGELNVPEGSDPQGVSVLNTTQGTATISNEAGLFRIRAALGDTLTFSSLQFQDFAVVIDQGVVNTGQLIISISEAVTRLPEVIVTPYDLSGNVRVDVKLIPTRDLDLPTQSAAEINPYEWEFRPDSKVSPDNAAMKTSMIYNGAKFAGIFRSIFDSRTVIKNLERDEELLEIRDDEFFEEQLNIKDEHLKEFIFFVRDNGLTPEMLQPENEMKLISFLVAQSQEFNIMKANQ